MCSCPGERPEPPAHRLRVGLERPAEVGDPSLDQELRVREARQRCGRPGQPRLDLRLLGLERRELPGPGVEAAGPHPEVDSPLGLDLDLREAPPVRSPPSSGSRPPTHRAPRRHSSPSTSSPRATDLITRDTETGLEWLDLTATENLSYNDIEADVGGWISLGFRHATGSEVCGLFASHALAPSPCPGSLGGISASGDLVSTLQGFVGVTYFDARLLVASDGLYDDGDGDVSDGVGLGRSAYSPWTGMSSASLF
jgi:hypothetical protein